MSLFKDEVDLAGDAEVAQLRRAEPLPWHTIITDQGNLLVTKCHYAFVATDMNRKTFGEIPATSDQLFCERCSPQSRKKPERYSSKWNVGASE